MSPRAWIRRGAAAAAASAALIIAFQPAATAAPRWWDGQSSEAVRYSKQAKHWKNGDQWRHRTRWTPPARETNQAPPPSTEPQAGPGASPDPAPAGGGSFADQIVEHTNAERAKAGLAPLKRSDCLTKHAQNWSNHMSSVGRMYHSNLGDWMRDCSLRSAGENVAYGGRSAAETVQMWMDSPGHRQNILNPGYTHMGAGVEGPRSYATQTFGSD